jgi:hypothetical protein
MNKAKANPAKLVPLKQQATNAIQAALTKMVTQTRAGSASRRLMNDKIFKAQAAYRAGDYVKAATLARTAHI